MIEDAAAERFLDQIRRLRRASLEGTRAPHKPLVLLYALARLKNDGVGRLPFTEVEAVVRPLLLAHAPAVREVKVANPFIRLAGDGFWSVAHADGTGWRGSTYVPARGVIRADNPTAGFDQPTLDLLRRHPDLINRAARLLLDENFPPGIQEDLLSALGLDLDSPAPRPGAAESSEASRRRDPQFRTLVLDAYRRKCACCGFSLRVGDGLVGVDAAHIRWHNHDGPDEVSKGLALCALHHRLFDYGVLTIGLDRLICIADGVNGEHAEQLLEHLHAKPVALPRDTGDCPDDSYLKWHHRNVFKGRRGAAALALHV